MDKFYEYNVLLYDARRNAWVCVNDEPVTEARAYAMRRVWEQLHHREVALERREVIVTKAIGVWETVDD